MPDLLGTTRINVIRGVTGLPLNVAKFDGLDRRAMETSPLWSIADAHYWPGLLLD